MDQYVPNAKTKLREIRSKFNGNESHDNLIAYEYDKDLDHINSDLSYMARCGITDSAGDMDSVTKDYEEISAMRYKVKTRIWKEEREKEAADRQRKKEEGIWGTLRRGLRFGRSEKANSKKAPKAGKPDGARGVGTKGGEKGKKARGKR